MKVDIDVIRPGTPSEADQRRRKLLYFIIANVISVAVAAGIFLVLLVGIPEGQGFDHVMAEVRAFLRSHMGISALAASTPFFASLLVGQYEARRARARRARKEAEERRARLEEEFATEQAQRAARRTRPR
ncbi:MAG TPA: hypothetical protein VH877_25190 [Polyangia bacterium]|jgi:hypothetical protein|nr:hypothetical protein [Polyangia bacterium]